VSGGGYQELVVEVWVCLNLSACNQTPFLATEFAGLSTQVNLNSTPRENECMDMVA